MHNLAIGVDIGGTGIKLASVDLASGELMSERIKIPTPPEGTPADIAEIVRHTIQENEWQGDLGVGFPTPIRKGICVFHSNLHPHWEGTNIAELFSEATGKKVSVGNDVDVAALGEMTFGDIPQGLDKVLFLALGTGIGSALFFKGQLIAGTEFGHVKFRKSIAEHYASNRVREEEELSWKKWGGRLNKVLAHLDFILDVDLFVLGGGVSKKFHKFEAYLDFGKPVRAAQLQNNAGVIGAAMLTTV